MLNKTYSSHMLEDICHLLEWVEEIYVQDINIRLYKSTIIWLI